jgi:hypothetical protein
MLDSVHGSIRAVVSIPPMLIAAEGVAGGALPPPASDHGLNGFCPWHPDLRFAWFPPRARMATAGSQSWSRC